MKFLNELLPIFRFYQLCGFAPFSIPLNSKRENIGQYKFYFYSASLTIFFGIFLLLNIIFFNIFFGKEKSEMLAYLSLLILVIMRALTVIIMIDSLLKMKPHMEFLSHFSKIEQIFSNELQIELDYKRIRRNSYVWMSIWLVQITILLSLIVMEVIYYDEGIMVKLFWLFSSFPLIIISMRYYQIIHYIRLLGFCFEFFNELLNDISSNTNRLHMGDAKLPTKNMAKFNDNIYDKIVSLRQLFHVLWETTIVFNKTFEWSLLTLIATSFFCIVVNYYRTLLWLISPESMDVQNVITFMIWASGHTFFFIKLSSTCYHISQQVIKIPIHLHNIAFKIRDRNLNFLVMEEIINQ